MRLRYLIPAALFLMLGAGFVYALVAIQSGKKNPSEVPSALIGKPAPEFALPAPAGFPQGLSSADLKGKVTILNVFASWCPPCHVEHPLLLELAKEAKGGAFQLVGLNWKDKDEKLAAWFKEAGDPFSRIGADRTGRIGIEWGVYGAPETYILDRDAKIVYRYAGPLTKELIRDEIRPILAKLKK
jgi:cytochrome c biogenesis protein CcmG/thiol:disulfide interchange protein DsbE